MFLTRSTTFYQFPVTLRFRGKILKGMLKIFHCYHLPFIMELRRYTILNIVLYSMDLYI